MSKKSGNKLKTLVKRGISAALVGIMGLSMITASDMYYGYSPNTAYAAELAGISGVSNYVKNRTNLTPLPHVASISGLFLSRVLSWILQVT